MKKKNNTALYLSLTILALIWLVPIVTVFITSLKSNSDFFSGMGLFDLPEKLQWHNYSDAWSKGHLDRYIRNGLIVTCLKVPIMRGARGSIKLKLQQGRLLQQLMT